MKKLSGVLGLLLALCSFVPFDSSDDTINQLKDKIAAFQRAFKRTKLDLYFDQPKYSPGDTAHVRTLYVTAADFKAVEGRQIIYLNFFDQLGARVFTSRLLVINGLASNDLLIPNSLNPGIYTLVAYSDWMKNMDSSLFFRRTFIVTGPQLLIPDPQKTDKEVVEFYPEGGSMVSGIENNVVVRIPLEFRNDHVIIRSGAEEISVKPDQEGLASVNLTPKQDASLVLEATLDGKRLTFELPKPTSSGFAMLANITADQRTVYIQAGEGMDASKNYFLIVTNSQGLIFSKPFEVKYDQPATVNLPNLPPGIANLAIIDGDFHVWQQRTCLFKTPIDISASIHLPKSSFATREDVSVDIEVVDPSGNPVVGRFTTRVVSQSLFQDSLSDSKPGDQFLLYSDISSTFKLISLRNEQTVNRYLITQSCPWLPWEKILSAPTASAAHPAFVPTYKSSGTVAISGKMISLENGLPVPDSTQIMFFLQKQIFGYEVYTHSKGRFECPIMFDLSGDDQIFFAATYHGRDINSVSLQLTKEDSAYSFKSYPWASGNSEDPYGVYAFQKKLIDKSFSFFTGNKIVRDSLADPNAEIEEELQGADVVLNVSDYIIFPTMVDLIREVLRSVEYRKIRGKDVMRVYTTLKRPTNSAGPLYVIDGVMTKDPTYFLGLKPADVITIKVIKDSNKLLKFGSLGANGILLIRTRRGDGGNSIHKENTFPFFGLAPKDRKGEAPKTPATIPDLRPTLFWDASQILDSSGKGSFHFTTSDDVGIYNIQIEGITSTGIPFSKEQSIKIDFNHP
jgi:hypothetical protein